MKIVEKLVFVPNPSQSICQVTNQLAPVVKENLRALMLGLITKLSWAVEGTYINRWSFS
jgi:hypothetical protein